MKLFNKATGLSVLFGMSALLGNTTALAAPASVEFSAKIAFEGACDISAPSSVVFNSGDAILPSAIEAETAVTQQAFDLTLTNCQGIGVTPKIKVMGYTNSEYGEDLFVDTAGTTSVGYGILLQTVGNASFKANTNLATTNMISAIDDWDTDTSLTTINGKIPMTAALTCSDCTADGRIGGELKANVTFDFEYD